MLILHLRYVYKYALWANINKNNILGDEVCKEIDSKPQEKKENSAFGYTAKFACKIDGQAMENMVCKLPEGVTRSPSYNSFKNSLNNNDILLINNYIYF